MWVRAELKSRAWQSLRNNGYWVALSAVVIVIILSGGIGGVGNTGQGPVGVEYRLNAHEVNQLGDFMRSISPMLLFVVFGSILLSISYGVFVANPLSVGKSRFFLEHRLRRPSVGLVFWPFSSGSYLNVVKATFMQVLIIALWSLLLIVPGIVKSYQYALVPYILAENPGLSWRRALDLSRSMTDGCKFDIFVLQLSFIGWYLLGLLALFIGTILVAPYPEATMAELYATLREQALARGVTSEDELPGIC